MSKCIKVGEIVNAAITKIIPEHKSKKTGELIPEKIKTTVVTGKVICYNGDKILINVKKASGWENEIVCFRHEITRIGENPLAL
jgi:hypothetical protein